MSDNSSSSDSFLYLLTNICFRSGISIFVFSAVSITNVLLFPVFLLVLYLGYQQQRQQHASSTTPTTHSDLFTYHATTMQLIEFLGLLLLFCGSYNNLSDMTWVGLCFFSVTSSGQALFHILTCVEHYLAVVHPVTYLHLKQADEVRIRNICTGCVWLLSFGWVGVYSVSSYGLTLMLYLLFMALYLIIISFCSISVLCALKCPGPGEVSGNKERVNQSKQRVFNTIMTIMGVLLFRFVGNLILTIIYSFKILSTSSMCVALMSSFWLDLPSGLVLPLLFLHRVGKLECCKHNYESG